MDTEKLLTQLIYVCSLSVISYLAFALYVYILRIYRIRRIRIKKHTVYSKKIRQNIAGRSILNPIIKPSPHNAWEAEGTFNPAVWKNNGITHMVYRAVGSDGISRLGYAESTDGEHFQQLHYPIYTMETPRLNCLKSLDRMQYNRVMYPSGGSYGGAEDPRMVEIEGKIYITCSAFDGWDFIRIAVLSIDTKDFIQKKWKWNRPLLISPEGEVHKNWVLFPEKIQGKFAILHTITPNLEIEYVDRLEDLAHGKKKITSVFSQTGSTDGWDYKVRGAGSPPIRTSYGWLLLYHATDKAEPHRYKVGAILLDIDNPSQILARSMQPVLTPDMWYENEWKQGVVYVCGAFLEKGILYVYYGGGDKYVCLAKIEETHLLEWLKGDIIK